MAVCSSGRKYWQIDEIEFRNWKEKLCCEEYLPSSQTHHSTRDCGDACHRTESNDRMHTALEKVNLSFVQFLSIKERDSDDGPRLLIRALL